MSVSGAAAASLTEVEYQNKIVFLLRRGHTKHTEPGGTPGGEEEQEPPRVRTGRTRWFRRGDEGTGEAGQKVWASRSL